MYGAKAPLPGSVPGRQGELAHHRGVRRAGDGGEDVGEPGQEPVPQQGEGHRLLGVAAQAQRLLGAHPDAVGAQPAGEGGQQGGVVAPAAADDELRGPVPGQDIALIGVGDGPGGELRGGGGQIVEGEAVLPAVGEDARRVLLAEVLPAGALGQGEGVVLVPGQLLQQGLAHPAPGGGGPVLVEPPGPVGGGGDDGVDDHVARPGVEGVDGLRPAAGGEDGHVADAADVLEQDGLAGAAVEQVLGEGHQGGPLPARRHVGHPEVGDGGDAFFF